MHLNDSNNWQVGDIVTRDGSDLQQILEMNEPKDLMNFCCIKEPSSGWAKIGDCEWNVPWRYDFEARPVVSPVKPPSSDAGGDVHQQTERG